MNYKYFLEKVVISCALGGRDKSQIEKIIDHSTTLLRLSRSPHLTTCKRQVAAWKTRKGIPMGYRITLRKGEAAQVLRVLGPRVPWSESKYDHSSLRVGIPSHRMLNLERYNYRDPEYGFNVCVCFSFKGISSWRRRINPCRRSVPRVPEEECRRLFNDVKD